MKTSIYLVLGSLLLNSLLVGCASAGRAGIERSSVKNTAQPAKTEQPALPATLDLDAAPSASGVVLTAYDWSQKGYTLLPVDPATGEAVPGHTPVRISQGELYMPHLAYSPDGSKLAAIESRGESCEAFAGGTSCYPRAIALRLVDLPSWQVISTALPADGWVGAISFSPGADRLAISYNRQKGNSVLVIDTSSGEVLSELALGFRPEGIAFYRDNSQLLAYGTLPAEVPGFTPPGPLRLEAYSIPSGERLWGRELADVTRGSWCIEGCKNVHGQQLYAAWYPAIVLSPDGSLLYILHADQDKLTRVSLAGGSSESVEIREAQSWIERLLASTADVALAKGGAKGTTRLGVISPDGKRLYAQSITTDAVLNQDGFWESADAVTELQVIDTQSGQILARKPASGYGLSLTPDGKYLLSGAWTETGVDTEIWSADDLEKVVHVDGWELVFSRNLDGNIVLLGSRRTDSITEIALFDLENFQVKGGWKYSGLVYWIPAH